MKKKDIRQHIYDQLLPTYGEREALGMERIIWEDYLSQADEFPADDPPTDEVSEEAMAKITAFLEKVNAGHPVQYMVGKALFYGRYFSVGPGVLIPRQETEQLVMGLAKRIRTFGAVEGPILDLCTGSGCTAIAMQLEFPDSKVLGYDISPEALEYAQKNAKDLEQPVEFSQLDILDESRWAELPTCGAIISNPPYIPHEQKNLMSKNVLEHEPEIALFVADDDPMLFYRTIAKLGQQKLNTGGHVALEINEHFPSEAMTIFLEHGYTEMEVGRDISQRNRLLYAIKS